MLRIVDVAREAGVSVATVSRALNEHPTVNPELAERVREVAARLGYRPNGIARSLRRQSSDVLALIISDVSDPFFTAITRGVEDVAQNNGLSVLLCNADENPEKEARYLRVVEQQQVAGVVLSPHSSQSDISRLRTAGVPVVVIDRPLSPAGNEDLDSVMVRSSDGARIATRHLLDEGWLRPGCVTGPQDAMTAEQRLEGYREALREAGDVAAERVARAEFSLAGGRAATAELLDGADSPDAIFVANSSMALGMLAELEHRGLQVGADIGAVMFDDAPWAPFLSSPMTVVAQPAYQIGARAAELLLDRIRDRVDGDEAGTGAGSGRHVLLSTELIVRTSSIISP